MTAGQQLTMIGTSVEMQRMSVVEDFMTVRIYIVVVGKAVES